MPTAVPSPGSPAHNPDLSVATHAGASPWCNLLACCANIAQANTHKKAAVQRPSPYHVAFKAPISSLSENISTRRLLIPKTNKEAAPFMSPPYAFYKSLCQLCSWSVRNIISPLLLSCSYALYHVLFPLLQGLFLLPLHSHLTPTTHIRMHW